MMRTLAFVALSALLLSCAPMRTVPAVGSRLTFHACYSVRGVSVYRDPESKCPEYAAVEARVRKVEERYGPVSGATVYIVDAYIECGGGEMVAGCSIGDHATVAAGPLVLGTLAHELAHVAITRRYGDGSIAHYDLDHPEQRRSERF